MPVTERKPLRGWPVFPTRRLAILVAIAAGLWLLPGAWSLAAPVMLATIGLLALYDYARLPSASDIDVERQVPERMGLGDAEEVVYQVSSASERVVEATLHDAWPPAITGMMDAAPFALGSASPHSRVVAAVGQERGTHRFTPLAIRLRSSIGLVTRIVRAEAPGEVVVVPSLSNVRRLRLLAAQHRLTEAGVRAMRHRGEGTAFAGLRDYVPGDDPRHLDWKATARHARFITREQTVERSQSVFLMIDAGRAMTQLAGRYSRFEHVLSAALVLTDVAATRGDRVGMIAFDDAVRAFVPAQKGAAALRSLRTSLSALDASMTEPDYAAAFRTLALRQRRRALVVFFTDVVDARATRAFLLHAARVAQRHMLIVVAIQNEELSAAARPTSHGSAALFRSAAAEELIREREEALARMRQAGIAVLDVAVGQMAASVVSRYLEIKSRGLL